MATHRIAVLAGDGIGKEVMPEGLRVLEAAARKFRLDLAFTSYDWSCDYYAKHGRMMPEDWFSICLIGAPDSRMFESSSATPPPRFES